MKCKYCRLSQTTLSQIMPSGSDTPLLYFVFSRPNEDDARYASISGYQGMYVDGMMKSLNVSNYRKFSSVRCTPYNMQYPEAIGDFQLPTIANNLREPYFDEVEICSLFLKKDLAYTKPKVIVTLGEIATKSILGDKFSYKSKIGEKVKANILENEFLVVPTHSLTTSIGSISESAQEIYTHIRKALDIANGNYVDIMEDMEIKYATDYAGFKSYVFEKLINEPEISYDIETNAELVYSDKFDVIGFSLGKKRSGVYVCLDSLEYTMPKAERDLCESLLVMLLKNKNLIVHNANYERPATYFKYGYELPYEKVTDTLVMAKLLLGGKVGAGLKPNAQRIGYPDWDSDVGEYISNVKALIKRLGLVKFKPIIEMMRNNIPLDEIYLEYKEQEWASEAVEYIQNLMNVVEQYYDEVGAKEVYKRIPEKIICGFDNGIPGTIPYNWIPMKMLCRYGAIDAIATVDIKEHFLKRFDEESTPEVNLHIGYEHLLSEHYAGYAIMMSSLKWDDDRASKDYNYLSDLCLKSLRHVCMQDVIIEDILDKRIMDIAPEVIYEEYNDLFWDKYGRRVIAYKLDEDGNVETYKMEELVGGKVKKKHIKHLLTDITLPESLEKDIKERLRERVLEDIRTTDSVEVLKGYFNPASTRDEVNELATSLLVTPELRFAKLVHDLKLVVEGDGFSIDNYDDKDRHILNEVIDYLNIKKYSSDDWLEVRGVKYKELYNTIKSAKRFNDKELRAIHGASNCLQLEGLAEDSQIMMYEALKLTPIDDDDPSTWTPLFKNLICIRLYKKAFKILSAYIEGKIGRPSVYIVDKDKFINGEDVVKRGVPYNSRPRNEENRVVLGPNEEFMLQTNFSVATAATYRWQSSFHVIPSKSTAKRMYKSRYKGGVIAMPDYSANELRCVASAAKEENMLQAFREGLDIHKSNASKIYRVPLDEVTSVQRRFAKTLSFSILYGSSEQSIADSFFDGNLAEAKNLLNDFYSAFPNLKVWIDARHKEVLETGKVSVLTNRFVKIDYDKNNRGEASKALRQSQNFPIQSAASTLAAVVFSDIIRHQKSNNMKTKPILFIHDSLESDVYPYELFEVLEFQSKILAEGAIEKFGVACKADMAIGVNLGTECEVKGLEVLPSKTEGYVTLEGCKDDIIDTINNWKLAYNVVEIVEEEWEDKFIPMSQMFIERYAFDDSILTHRAEGKAKIHLRYYDEQGNISPITNEVAESVHEVSDFIDKIGVE